MDITLNIFRRCLGLRLRLASLHFCFHHFSAPAANEPPVRFVQMQSPVDFAAVRTFSVLCHISYLLFHRIIQIPFQRKLYHFHEKKAISRAYLHTIKRFRHRPSGRYRNPIVSFILRLYHSYRQHRPPQPCSCVFSESQKAPPLRLQR